MFNFNMAQLKGVCAFFLICFLFACGNKHPEMQGNSKLVLCDSLTMKQNHENCETIFIEPSDSAYSIMFEPFIKDRKPKNPYNNVYAKMTVNKLYQSFLTPLFDIIPLKNLQCLHFTGTDHLHHVYFNFKNNQLQSIDYEGI